MFACNKIFVSLSAVLMLSACASAMFPDFDDNFDDVEVREGGRVEKNLPKEGDVLRADTENVAYEGEEDKVVAAEVTPVEKEELAEKETAAVVETPVLEEPFDDEYSTVKAEEVNDALVVEETEDVAPSVSYRVETIYFDNGSAYVAPKYNQALRNVAKLAKENNAQVVVYGHSSSRTRDTDPASHKLANFKASMERAQNVAAALKRVGVPANKIAIEAMSDSTPAYLEVMPEGERLNRRAEIYIAY